MNQEYSQKEENGKERKYQQLQLWLERAMALQTANILFEWDNETLAPKQAGACTAKVQGALALAYQELMTGEEIGKYLELCEQETELSEAEVAILREAGKKRAGMYPAKGVSRLSGADIRICTDMGTGQREPGF